MTQVKSLSLPIGRAAVEQLRAGDIVTLDGEIVITAGLPTHERIREAIAGVRDFPFDLRGGSLFHLGSYSEDAPGGGIDIRYMNPTTSTRFNRYMPDFIRALDLRMVGGKGGLDDACVAAMRETGTVYLSFLGGGAPLLSAAMREVIAVGWQDLVAHYRLVRLRVAGLGPLVVAIDAHGDSLYARLRDDAGRRMPEILAGLDRSRTG